MKKKLISIQTMFLKNIILTSLASLGVLCLFWIYGEYNDFIWESELLRREYVQSQKRMLKNEVNSVVNYIEYMKNRTEIKLKNTIKERIYEAYEIALNIYKQNSDIKSPDEIKKMIKDALRPIRFNKGRGYYFILTMEGIEELFSDKPEMEGSNMLPIQGGKGEYVAKEIIDLVRQQQEGFYQYTWSKPNNPSGFFPKITFAKKFEPYDWVIGTGEYIDDVKNEIQNEVLERIVGLRFGEEGYFFGSIYGGEPLFTNGKITKGTGSIWHLTDPNGVMITQEYNKIVKNSEGGFVDYAWHKLDSSTPSPKIAFVMGIPDWEWIIGAGVYIDTIESTIADNEKMIKKNLIEKFIKSFVFLSLILAYYLYLTRRNAIKFKKAINHFSSFFQKAANELINIDPETLYFSELSLIADSANKMINDRKYAENSLKENEALLRTIAENFPNSYLSIVYKDFTVGFTSGQELKKQGLDSEMFVGKKVEDIFGDKSEIVKENYQRTFEGQECTFELFMNAQYQLYRTVPLHEEDGSINCILSVVENITDRRLAEKAKKEAENERLRLEAQLRQTQKMEAIGTLAGGIAHDFNNMLAVILGNTELALDYISNENHAYECLLETKIASLRAKELIKQILDFSRKNNFEREPIDITALLKECLRMVRASLPTTIKIQKNICGNSEIFFANPTQIYQIIVNLCTNAAHAMNFEGQLEILSEKITIEDTDNKIIQGLNSGKYMKISVSDTGSGIKPEHIDKIFDPYFTTKEVGKGSGLGLSVVYGIVKSHGGIITVYSELGKGSTFNVYLPIIESKEKIEKEELKPIPTGDETILFVDDEELLTKMAQRMLISLGYKVVCSTNPLHALELFRSMPDNFDLIITDMTMPDLPGNKLASELIKIRSDIPIIMCTGHSEIVNGNSAKQIGIKKYLMKPLTKRNIAEVIREVLEK
ncbi:MAG: cache domain-containing protein [Desulfobacterales bacterium]|nr:cache domain-containing protein [Desulfobacterales bacterium]